MTHTVAEEWTAIDVPTLLSAWLEQLGGVRVARHAERIDQPSGASAPHTERIDQPSGASAPHTERIDQPSCASVQRPTTDALFHQRQNHECEAPPNGTLSMGDVTLYPHQVEGVRRLRRILTRYGGALLADDVGLGKTFTAFGVASEYRRVLVVAPAAVRDMWKRTSRRCLVAADVISYEGLSTGHSPPVEGWDLLILDEAHHARNPTTRRFRALARLAWGRRLLLVSATPIHNRRRDLHALFSLFLGAGAASLSEAVLSNLIVRRTDSDLSSTATIPALRAVSWRAVPEARTVLEALRSLPPPLPPADGGVADALVTLQLVRAWCSSDAALLAAVRRRLATAIALEHALSHGRHPTRDELRAWSADESGALQLAFPEIAAAGAGHRLTIECLDTVRRHATALRVLRALVSGTSGRDPARFAAVRAALDQHVHEHHQGHRRECHHEHEHQPEHRREHQHERVVIFTHSAETARALFRALAPAYRVALLTGRGGRIASGPIGRAEVLATFAPTAGRPANRARGDARGEAVSDAASDAVSDAVSDAASDAVSDARGHTVSDARDHTASDAKGHTVSDALSDALSDAGGDALSDAGSDEPSDARGDAVRNARRNAKNDATRIDVLVASDVLSEGIDLQRASVLIHVDLPWTVARLEQRVGRVRRLGSTHTTVTQYAIAPPVDSEELSHLLQHLAAKAATVGHLIGDSPLLSGARWPFVSGTGRTHAPALAHDTVRARLRALITRMEQLPSQSHNRVDGAGAKASTTTVAIVHAAGIQGALVMLDEDGDPVLLADHGTSWSRAPDAVGKFLDLLLSTSQIRESVVDNTGIAPLFAALDPRTTSPASRHAHLIESTLGAATHWCRQHDAEREFIRASGAESLVHRRFLHQLGLTIANASRVARPRLAAREALARRLVMSSRGAGAEEVLARLLTQSPTPRGNERAAHLWLDEIIDTLGARVRDSSAEASSPTAVRGILLVVPLE